MIDKRHLFVTCRLNATGSEANSPNSSVQVTKKRKLVDLSETSTSSAGYHSIHDSTSASYVTVSTADVGIEIRDVDASGKFIRLYNKTDEVR